MAAAVLLLLPASASAQRVAVNSVEDSDDSACTQDTTGGIYVEPDAALNLDQVTVTQNVAQTGGGIYSEGLRNTKWLVADRCSSRLTRVSQARVSVRDFVKRKTVTVRAPKKYVARAKK